MRRYQLRLVPIDRIEVDPDQHPELRNLTPARSSSVLKSTADAINRAGPPHPDEASPILMGLAEQAARNPDVSFDFQVVESARLNAEVDDHLQENARSLIETEAAEPAEVQDTVDQAPTVDEVPFNVADPPGLLLKIVAIWAYYSPQGALEWAKKQVNR